MVNEKEKPMVGHVNKHEYLIKLVFFFLFVRREPNDDIHICVYFSYRGFDLVMM